MQALDMFVHDFMAVTVPLSAVDVEGPVLYLTPDLTVHHTFRTRQPGATLVARFPLFVADPEAFEAAANRLVLQATDEHCTVTFDELPAYFATHDLEFGGYYHVGKTTVAYAKDSVGVYCQDSAGKCGLIVTNPWAIVRIVPPRVVVEEPRKSAWEHLMELE